MAASPVWSRGTRPRRRFRHGARRWMLTLTLCSRHPCCRWIWQHIPSRQSAHPVSSSGIHGSTRRGRARARPSSALRPPASLRSGRPQPVTRSSGPCRRCSQRRRRAASSGRCSRIGTAPTHRASSASDTRAAQRHARHPRPYRRARHRSRARNVPRPPTPRPPPPSPPHHRPSARHHPAMPPASRATVPHHRRREVGRGPRQARWRRRRTGRRSHTAALALTASAATSPATTRARARACASPRPAGCTACRTGSGEGLREGKTGQGGAACMRMA